MKSVALADGHFHQPGPFYSCWVRMCTRHYFWMKGGRLMGFTIASLSSAGWSLECCPKCVPTNVYPFKLQWNWTLLASGKLRDSSSKADVQENRQCLEHYDTTTYVADDGPSLFVFLSNLSHVPRKTFKQPSSDCSPLNESSRITMMWSSSIVTSSRNLWTWVILNKHLRRLVCVTTSPITKFKDSTTTKLHVVFDASSKTPNSNSLNHCLLLGSLLEDDVFDILIRVLRVIKLHYRQMWQRCTGKWL